MFELVNIYPWHS